MKRRDFLRLSAAAGLAGGFGVADIQRALAADGLDLYMLSAFSGPFAANGKFGEMGGRLAVKSLSPSMGRSVAYHTIDTQGNTGTAVRKIQEAINQKQGRLFLGGALSSEALAVSREIEHAGGVYITYVGADEITGSACNRATFRWAVPTYGAIRQTVAPVADMLPKAKRWYTITPQYVFGEGLLNNAKDVFREKGIEHVGNSYHSLQDKEFSGYLTNAAASNADVLLILNFSQQSIDTLRQAVSFGLKKKMKIVVAWSAGLDQFATLGPDICEDVFFGVQYWHGHDAPANRAFVALNREVNRATPTYFTAADFAVTSMMLDAVRRANTTDPKRVAQTLESMKWAGITGDEEMRAFDHQVSKNYFLMRGKAKAKMRDADDFAEVVSFGKSFPNQGQSQCKLA